MERIYVIDDVMGSIVINRMTREVTSGNKPVELTYKEYELLLYLVKYHARVVSREELLHKIWGYDNNRKSRTLDIHIQTLRQKLGPAGAACIKTIRSIGYRFVMNEVNEIYS